MDRLWELTQDPESHARWDLRFSAIRPLEQLDSGGYRFEYERSMPFRTIRGVGTSIGERSRPDGTRTSALKFTTADRLSPIGDGRGFWRYEPHRGGVRFITGYDYRPGWGRIIDRVIMRRLIGWMTAWSFDRLRIWAERGESPERWPLVSVLQVWRGDRPRASRCRRAPATGRAMDGAPPTLETLEAP
jgi:hypothetical protein